MAEDIQAAILTIHEKIKANQRRKRKVRITADSVTIGSLASVDIELKRITGKFLAEIKYSESQWWIVNPLKTDGIRVNGKLVSLNHALKDQDQVLLDEHQIFFELEQDERVEKKKSYQFAPHPGTDKKLWDYLIEETEFDEILINGAKSVFVDLKGNLLKSPWTFSSDEFLFAQIEKHSKKSFGWAHWRQNRNLRIHAALPPAVEVPHICIRKARQHVFSLSELEERDFGNPEQISFLAEAVKNRENILISGATSAGKTVLLRSLVEQVRHENRLVILEEESETDWPHPHAVAIEAGQGGLQQAIVESLRMRPDRLIISEIRGVEAFDFLNAINTGHAGSMTTIHANSARDALSRLENLALMTGLQTNPVHIRKQLAQSLDILVQLVRDENGHRRIETITRITGIQQDVILLSDPIGIENSGISQEKDLKLV